MTDMNQALEQFMMDLQRFAEDGGEGAAEGTATDAPDSTPQAAPEPTEPVEQERFADMDEGKQLDFIKKNLLDDEEQPKETPEPVQAEPQTEPKEQTFEIVYNGEKKQVTQSELINLAQQGMDYTKKTQALADQRRELEAQYARLNQPQQPAEQQTAKAGDRIKGEYEAAISIVEKELGLQPGEYNMFDPMHVFALNQLIVRANLNANRQQAERRAVEQEVQKFGAEIVNEPMREQIENSFLQYIIKIGGESAKGAEKAQSLAMAYQRFQGNQATLDDCKLLKEHWNYVKGELTKAKNPAPIPQKPIAKPPMTEAPGVGRTSKEHAVLSMSKLRELSTSPERQMAYMKAAGIFDD